MKPRHLALFVALVTAHAAAFAGQAVPPASGPDPVALDIVRVFRDQQVVMTPPPDPAETRKRGTVPARVLFSPWVEPPMTLEQAYYAGLRDGEARREERAPSGTRLPPPPPPPAPIGDYERSWTWIPSFGFGIGSHGSLFHFGLSGVPPYWGWRPW